MYFESYKSIVLSDTHVPDIFISEYLPSMDCEFIKIYLYCLFLSKHNKHATAFELSKKLDIDLNRITDGLAYMQKLGIIKLKDNCVTLLDLKEKEIDRIYRMKTTSTPEEAAASSERNRKRIKIINTINKTFFQGLMSPSWYTDIDAWFTRYQFDEDVMFTLFQHCYDHKGLSKNYILKVADNWHSRNIKNAFDVDRYFLEYQKLRDTQGCIIKKLNLSRNLTDYEEEMVEKWTVQYGFGLEIIDYAMKKTTAKTNPNFKYIDAILTNWYENKLTSREEIDRYELQKKALARKKAAAATAPSVPQQTNYEQRKYTDEYFDDLYVNKRETV